MDDCTCPPRAEGRHGLAAVTAATEPQVDVDNLPPTQVLVLEVLASRARLGEPAWTFSTKLRPALEALESHRLIGWKHWTLPRTCLAWLTDSGRSAMLSATYKPPGGYTFTRSALIDVLTRLELRVPLSGPAAGKILAESMADAIIGALMNPEMPGEGN